MNSRNEFVSLNKVSVIHDGNGLLKVMRLPGIILFAGFVYKILDIKISDIVLSITFSILYLLMFLIIMLIFFKNLSKLSLQVSKIEITNGNMKIYFFYFKDPVVLDKRPYLLFKGNKLLIYDPLIGRKPAVVNLDFVKTEDKDFLLEFSA